MVVTEVKKQPRLDSDLFRIPPAGYRRVEKSPPYFAAGALSQAGARLSREERRSNDPQPTVRPFVVGVLLFLAVIGLWPGRARAATAPPARARSAPLPAPRAQQDALPRPHPSDGVYGAG